MMRRRIILGVVVALVGLSSIATSRPPQHWTVAHPTTQHGETFVLTPQQRFATLTASVAVPDSARALAELHRGTYLSFSVRAEIRVENANTHRTSTVHARLRGDPSELVDRVVIPGSGKLQLHTTMHRGLDPEVDTCPPRPEPCEVDMQVDFGWYGEGATEGEIRVTPVVTAIAQGVQRSRKKDVPQVQVQDGLELKHIRVTHSAEPVTVAQPKLDAPG